MVGESLSRGGGVVSGGAGGASCVESLKVESKFGVLFGVESTLDER